MAATAPAARLAPMVLQTRLAAMPLARQVRVVIHLAAPLTALAPAPAPQGTPTVEPRTRKATLILTRGTAPLQMEVKPLQMVVDQAARAVQSESIQLKEEAS